MEHQLILLWKLQQLEQKIKLLEKQKDKVNMQEAHEMWGKIKIITQNLNINKENLQKLKNICDEQEVELLEITDKYRQLEQRLYSGDIKNLKEIEQIRAQYEAVKQDVETQEKNYFRKVDDNDELSREIIALENILRDKKSEHAKKQQAISGEIADIDAEIAKIRTQYQDLLNQVDPVFFEKYKVIKQKMSLPIAEIKNGICGGCRMGLPESKNPSQGKIINYCDHCGRILIKIQA